ncbi:MAG: DHH family phosphoesterase [Phycisphaerales bacterium]|nr:DHH family phosphoesterase [Phycisphaerales bacterium]
MTIQASQKEDPSSIWTNTIDAKAVADWIDTKKTLVLLTHTKPDGDALGSTLALARAINLKRGTTGAVSAAECWYATPMPDWGKKLATPTKYKLINPPQPAPAVLDPDGIIITDTGSWSQLAPFKEFLEPRLDRTTIIDHHLQGNAEISTRRLLDTTAAAAVQPAARVCCHLLELDNPSQLPIDIATPLYVGLATDTGWFKHSNVNGQVMRLAGQLLDAGVNHSNLFAMLYQNDRTPRLKLMGRALNSIEILKDKNAAIMQLTHEDFKQTKAAPGDSGGFVDIPQSVEAIRVVAILNEQHDQDGTFTKISLRSKPDPWNDQPAVDVNQVCQTLGGGGHARAAGAKVRQGLEETKRLLIEALP